MNSAAGDGGESLTVQQLLRQLAPDYRQRFAATLPERHRHVLKKIVSCRSPAMGGQLFQCPACPGFHYRYHSCNDRHCPQCGQTDADDWLKRQQPRLLLPVPYFLLTFTVPEASRKHDLGFTLMNQLATAQKRIPRSEQDIAADIFALRKSFAGSRWVFSEGRNPLNTLSHCDIAWAAALSTHAHLNGVVQAGAWVA